MLDAHFQEKCLGAERTWLDSLSKGQIPKEWHEIREPMPEEMIAPPNPTKMGGTDGVSGEDILAFIEANEVLLSQVQSEKDRQALEWAFGYLRSMARVTPPKRRIRGTPCEYALACRGIVQRIRRAIEPPVSATQRRQRDMEFCTRLVQWLFQPNGENRYSWGRAVFAQGFLIGVTDVEEPVGYKTRPLLVIEVYNHLRDSFAMRWYVNGAKVVEGRYDHEKLQDWAPLWCEWWSEEDNLQRGATVRKAYLNRGGDALPCMTIAVYGDGFSLCVGIRRTWMGEEAYYEEMRKDYQSLQAEWDEGDLPPEADPDYWEDHGYPSEIPPPTTLLRFPTIRAQTTP